jgi:hypothetical protein
MEWSKQAYNNQYENWMPWIEDVYLRWFTKDNKASYTAKGQLPNQPTNQQTNLLVEKSTCPWEEE